MTVEEFICPLTAGIDKIIVRITDRMNETITGGGGMTLTLPHASSCEQENSQEQRKIFGTVAAVTRVLSDTPILMTRTPNKVTEAEWKYMHDIALEVRVNDKVYFSYLQLTDNTWLGKTAFGEDMYAIPYNEVFAVVRDGEIIPIGGHILVSPVYEDGVEELSMPDGTKVFGRQNGWGMVVSLNEKPMDNCGYIQHVGTPLKGDDACLRKGMMIAFLPRKKFYNEIEGKGYWVMRQEDALIEIVSTDGMKPFQAYG